MKIELENTDKLVTIVVNGVDVPARVWQGEVEIPGHGKVPIHAMITRIGVKEGLDAGVYGAFSEALTETAKMRPDVSVIPLRLIL